MNVPTTAELAELRVLGRTVLDHCRFMGSKGFAYAGENYCATVRAAAHACFQLCAKLEPFFDGMPGVEPSSIAAVGAVCRLLAESPDSSTMLRQASNLPDLYIVFERAVARGEREVRFVKDYGVSTKAVSQVSVSSKPEGVPVDLRISFAEAIGKGMPSRGLKKVPRSTLHRWVRNPTNFELLGIDKRMSRKPSVQKLLVDGLVELQRNAKRDQEQPKPRKKATK